MLTPKLSALTGLTLGTLLLGACGQTPSPSAARPAAGIAALSVDEVQHGPAPTLTSITKNGPYTVQTVTIPASSVKGFGGGLLYFPGNAAPGERFAGIVAIPGFMGSAKNELKIYGTRYASHGFIVLTAEANSVFDLPEERAKAVTAALAYLKSNATVAPLLNTERIALVGHSMGGGGVLTAAETLDVQAVLAIHPWAQRGFPGIKVPTHIIGGLIDTAAPVKQHAWPIYLSLTGAPQKSILNRFGGTHIAGLTDDPAIQGRNLTFLKTFLDKDSRYLPLYCGVTDTTAMFTASGPACATPVQP